MIGLTNATTWMVDNSLFLGLLNVQRTSNSEDCNLYLKKKGFTWWNLEKEPTEDSFNITIFVRMRACVTKASRLWQDLISKHHPFNNQYAPDLTA